jgi:hypothetical protein
MIGKSRPCLTAYRQRGLNTGEMVFDDEYFVDCLFVEVIRRVEVVNKLPHYNAPV